LIVSNKAVMLTNLDCTVSFPQPVKRPAYIDTSEMGLIRKLDTIRINVFLDSPLVTTTTSPVHVINSRLDRYPSQT